MNDLERLADILDLSSAELDSQALYYFKNGVEKGKEHLLIANIYKGIADSIREAISEGMQ